MLFLVGMVPGFVARDFFDRLAPTRGQLDIWWLRGRCCCMSALGRIVFMLGCQLTNMPFMLTSASLLQKNMLRAHPGAARRRARPAQPPPGEAISRFRDDVERRHRGHDHLQRPDRVARVFAVIALVIMFSDQRRRSPLGVFLPLAGGRRWS